MKKEQEPQQKIITLKELDKTTDKVDFSQLPEGDKFQLTCRYLNDLCSITKSTLQIIADLYVLMEFICEHEGIDVKAKKQELARKIQEKMDLDIENSKKELQKASKNN